MDEFGNVLYKENNGAALELAKDVLRVRAGGEMKPWLRLLALATPEGIKKFRCDDRNAQLIGRAEHDKDDPMSQKIISSYNSLLRNIKEIGKTISEQALEAATDPSLVSNLCFNNFSTHKSYSAHILNKYLVYEKAPSGNRFAISPIAAAIYFKHIEDGGELARQLVTAFANMVKVNVEELLSADDISYLLANFHCYRQQHLFQLKYISDDCRTENFDSRFELDEADNNAYKRATENEVIRKEYMYISGEYSYLG